MKSFAVAALAGAASAAWAPPAYGGASSESVVSSVPAEGYTQPAGYTSEAQPTGYTSETQPAGYESSSAASSSAATSAQGYSQPPVYGSGSASSSMATSYACNPAHAYPNGAQCISTAGSLTLVTPSSSAPGAYGTGSAPAYTPVPTGGYGGSWGQNGTQGGANGGDSYVTQVVTSYETYCPYATTVVQNSKTYTVSEATTLTITDCPCTAVTPVQSYTPEVTTKVYTSFTTTCPEATTVTYGPSTYTVESSTVLTVTDCPGGCSVTEEVPATWVVPTYSTVFSSPSAPTTVTVGTQTYPVSDQTTIIVTAPTSYATYTSVISQPEQPTSYVIASTTYPVSEATTITYSQPTQEGYTITGPAPVPTGESPVAPVPGQPSGYAPAPSGYPAGNGSSPVSPYGPEQTGNGAEKLMAGGAAIAAVVGALFL